MGDAIVNEQNVFGRLAVKPGMTVGETETIAVRMSLDKIQDLRSRFSAVAKGAN